MAQLLEMADRAALSDAKVLVTGESGVGKDLIARQIHCKSARANKPFVALNCASLTDTLLESELFGHMKGSFTGAYRDKPGKLHLAHRGTIFLDEVGEMSLRMQALLLRFLENGEIQAVGSDHAKTTVDVRVVAATNRELGEMVSGGQFREDLLYRLRVIHLHVLPLRERREDIPVLVEHFASKTKRRATFSEDAIAVMERYSWPGNVRELQHAVEQAVWLSPDNIIEVAHLPVTIKTPAPSFLASKERRRQVADDLYHALIGGGYSFWEHIYPLFLNRDMTRHDLRELIRRGLAITRGSYRGLLKLYRIPKGDYKRFLNFLAAHDCHVNFREYRYGTPEGKGRTPRVLLPPLEGTGSHEPPRSVEVKPGRSSTL
jgi:DNA-binding NtrC family response regulator